MQNQSEIKAKCYRIIDGFLHREVLVESDVRAWVSEVVGVHGEMAVWHAVRAGGFGGSEIGVLVRNYLGHRADHMNSAHDIVMGKLLRATPSSETGDLRRGHDNEERHAQWFYEKYAAERDVGAFDQLSKATGPREWMRYSPDELALIPTDESNPALGGRKQVRILADYKAPRAVDEADEIAFQYSCQLHQGAMICAHAGIHIDGMMLSQFDWAGWRLKDDQLPYDAELAKAILQAGDHYWAFVMRGDVPPYIFRERMPEQEAFAQMFASRGTMIAQMKAMSKALSEQAEELSAEILEEIGKYRVAGMKLAIGDLNVQGVAMVDHAKLAEFIPEEKQGPLLSKGSPSYDADAMARRLRQMGENLKPYRKVKFDDELTWSWLVENGHDPEQMMTEQIRLGPSKALVEEARNTVSITYGLRAPACIEALSAGETNDREGADTERMAPRSMA